MDRTIPVAAVLLCLVISGTAGAGGRLPFDMVPRNPPSPMRSVAEIKAELERNAPKTKKNRKGRKKGVARSGSKGQGKAAKAAKGPGKAAKAAKGQGKAAKAAKAAKGPGKGKAASAKSGAPRAAGGGKVGGSRTAE